MERNIKHDLIDFLEESNQEIAREYARIRRRSKEDPGTAGDQGEENWATILRSWLPSYYRVVTKGRILGTQGPPSDQVDVIVLKPSYPPALVDKKLYLAGGVAMAFECKNTLKAEHIEKTINNCLKIKSLYASRSGSPYRELHSPILFGVLAHSHSWESEDEVVIDLLSNKIKNYEDNLVDHPRFLIDLLCVGSLTTWTRSFSTFTGPNQLPGVDWAALSRVYGPNGSATRAASDQVAS